MRYAVVNAALRSGDSRLLEHNRTEIDAIDVGLTDLPIYHGLVERGTDLSQEQAARYVPGKIVTEHSFLSTSQESRETFPGNTHFYITSKNGRDVSEWSAVPQEKEVLFQRGTQFEVRANLLDQNSGERIIVLREINRKE